MLFIENIGEIVTWYWKFNSFLILLVDEANKSPSNKPNEKWRGEVSSVAYNKRTRNVQTPSTKSAKGNQICQNGNVLPETTNRLKTETRRKCFSYQETQGKFVYFVLCILIWFDSILLQKKLWIKAKTKF